jgi:Uma2 family endonuclease
MLQLAKWNPGGQVFPPDSGFKMPDTAILSPDAAWVAQGRWAAVARDRAAFLALVPDVCAEIRSPSDTWAWLKRKVDRYVAYGACFAVAINPETREVYEAGEAPDGLKLDYDRILDAGT